MNSSQREIMPIRHPLNAAVRMPGSKSQTNRALLIASLAEGESRLTNALFSDDTLHLAGALQRLGLGLQTDEAQCQMIVTGTGGRIPAEKAELYVGNAGTAARFLAAFLTLGRGEYVLDGDSRMRERPIGDLVSALNQLGASVKAASGCLPARVMASGLAGGKTILTGDTSSQFLSALLMIAPYARRPVEIELSTPLASRPYVDMTLSVMRDFGIAVERQEYQCFRIQPASYHGMESYAIESDASSASYFFAAPAICGGSVRVMDIARSSPQGDLAFLDILEDMGCTVKEGSGYIEVTGGTPLLGVEVDLSDCPDIAQTLAAIAPFAITATRIRGIASARLKETDRVHATCTELRQLGVRVEEHPDGMTIYPSPSLRPACIRTYNDHRMAMAFSLIGLRSPSIGIEDPECVSKTFPTYFEVLESLR